MAINLEECGILRDDILNGVVNQLLENFDGVMYSQVENAVQNAIGKRVEKLVDQKVGEVIDSYLAKPIQPVDIWGDKKGAPKTIHEMLESSLASWWTTKVNRAGKPVSSSYDAVSTRIDFYMKKNIEDVLNNEMKDAMSEVIKETKAHVKAAMLKSVEELVNKNLR